MTTRWYFRRSVGMRPPAQYFRRRSRSARQHGPDADGHEADAGDELEGLRLDEALELRADENADAGGEDERACGAGEDDPFVGLTLGGEEEGGELGLVADLGEEDGDEDGGEGLPHRRRVYAISPPSHPVRERPYGVGSLPRVVGPASRRPDRRRPAAAQPVELLGDRAERLRREGRFAERGQRFLRGGLHGRGLGAVVADRNRAAKARVAHPRRGGERADEIDPGDLLDAEGEVHRERVHRLHVVDVAAGEIEKIARRKNDLLHLHAAGDRRGRDAVAAHLFAGLERQERHVLERQRRPPSDSPMLRAGDLHDRRVVPVEVRADAGAARGRAIDRQAGDESDLALELPEVRVHRRPVAMHVVHAHRRAGVQGGVNRGDGGHLPHRARQSGGGDDLDERRRVGRLVGQCLPGGREYLRQVGGRQQRREMLRIVAFHIEAAALPVIAEELVSSDGRQKQIERCLHATDYSCRKTILLDIVYWWDYSYRLSAATHNN